MTGVTSIVFLDVDGVLQVRPRATYYRSLAPKMLRGSRFVQRAIRVPVVTETARERTLSKAAIEHLNALCTRTQARVVVSSSWRLTHFMPDVLAAWGFTGACHPDWRTDADGPTRGSECRRWLLSHGDPPHVILDDWIRQFAPGERRTLVHVDYRTGLTEADGLAAAAILKLARPRQAALDATVE